MPSLQQGELELARTPAPGGGQRSPSPDAIPCLLPWSEYCKFSSLPDQHFVFAEHNAYDGYQWVYFVADGSDDDPPMFIVDEEQEPKQVARTIWEFVESLVVGYEIWDDAPSE